MALRGIVMGLLKGAVSALFEVLIVRVFADGVEEAAVAIID